MTEESFLGFKAATTVAGFLGAVVSLSAIKPMNKWQAFLAVFTGAATSAYGTPLATYYLSITSMPAENGLAFLLGLIAMHLIPGIIRMAELFRRDPLSFIDRQRSKRQHGTDHEH